MCMCVHMLIVNVVDFHACVETWDRFLFDRLFKSISISPPPYFPLWSATRQPAARNGVPYVFSRENGPTRLGGGSRDQVLPRFRPNIISVFYDTHDRPGK